MKVPKWVRAELTQRVVVHTSQAIGGVLTASGVDLPALSQGELTVDSFSRLAAGVIVQTVTVFASQWVARRRAKKAAEAIAEKAAADALAGAADAYRAGR